MKQVKIAEVVDNILEGEDVMNVIVEKRLPPMVYQISGSTVVLYRIVTHIFPNLPFDVARSEMKRFEKETKDFKNYINDILVTHEKEIGKVKTNFENMVDGCFHFWNQLHRVYRHQSCWTPTRTWLDRIFGRVGIQYRSDP